MDAPFKDLQFRLALSRNPAQKKGLAHVIENSSVRDSCLLKDFVCESAKTQNIDIEDPFLRGFRNDLLLGLHRILIRDNDHIVAAGLIPPVQRILCMFQYHIVQKPALA